MSLLLMESEEELRKDIFMFTGYDEIIENKKEVVKLILNLKKNHKDYEKELIEEIMLDDDLNEEECELLIEKIKMCKTIDELIIEQLQSSFVEVVFFKEIIENYSEEKNFDEIVGESLILYLDELKKNKQLFSLKERVIHRKMFGEFNTFIKTHPVSNKKNNVIDNKGLTYAIYHNGTNLIKIGKTNNLEARLKQFKTAIPYEIKYKIIGDDSLELKLHRYFKNKRKDGEWFDVTLEEIDRWAELYQGKKSGIKAIIESELL